MDFKPFKKDRKPGPDGHYDWESPGLRARIDEAKRTAKPPPTQVVMPTKDWADQAMINRDEKQGVMVEKPRAESVCNLANINARIAIIRRYLRREIEWPTAQTELSKVPQ